MSINRSTRHIPTGWIYSPAHRQTNFSSCSTSELLDRFRSEIWHDDSKWCNEQAVCDEAVRTGREVEHVRFEHVAEQKRQLCQEVENRLSASQSRPSAHVTTTFAAPNSRGSYYDFGHEIEVNEANFNQNPYSILGTIVHEDTHAHQVTGNGYDRHTLTMMDIEAARDSDGALYNYNDLNWEKYRTTCCELDSNNKAASFMINLQDRFGDDPEYRAYICEQQENYERVNNILSDVKSRQVTQLQQISNSLNRGHISPVDAAFLKDNILRAGDENQPFVDSTVQTHHELSEKLTEMAQQYRDEQASFVNNTEYAPSAPFADDIDSIVYDAENTQIGPESTEGTQTSFAEDMESLDTVHDSIGATQTAFPEDIESAQSAFERAESAHSTFANNFGEKEFEQSSSCVQEQSSFAEDVASEQGSCQSSAETSSQESSFSADVSNSSAGSYSSEGSAGAEASAGIMSVSSGQAH